MKIQVKHVAMVIVTASLIIPVSATAKEKAAPKVDCYQQASALGFTGSGGKRDQKRRDNFIARCQGKSGSAGNDD